MPKGLWAIGAGATTACASADSVKAFKSIKPESSFPPETAAGGTLGRELLAPEVRALSENRTEDSLRAPVDPASLPKGVELADGEGDATGAASTPDPAVATPPKRSVPAAAGAGAATAA
jgi:hypothetical protein